MTKAEKIENYIKECFSENALDYSRYFSVYDDENDEMFEFPAIDENGKINKEVVKRAAEVLGMNEEDIVNMNEEGILKWWKKYYYIERFPEYEVYARKPIMAKAMMM